MFDDLKRIGLEACVLIAFGALFGLTLHYQLVLDAFSGRLVPEQRPGQEESASNAFPLPVLIDEVQKTLAAGGLIVDARSPELYAMGHIDGAVSLPLVGIENVLPGFLGRAAKDQMIITYCSGFGCTDSFDLGVQLIESGYRDVRVFEGGYPEWRDAGLPVTAGAR
jgi:rhodanese-related sulfurtransferase